MARRPSPVVDLLTWVPFRAVLALLGGLPESWSYALASGLGRFGWALFGARRALVLKNLARAFPEAGPVERELLCRECFASAARILVDLARSPRIVGRGGLEERVDLSEARRALEEAGTLAPGKPPIFCTPHLGSWEVGGTALAHLVGRCHIIARPIRSPRIDAWFRSRRSLLGQVLHPRRGGIRGVRAGLAMGEAAGFLPDQNQRLRGVFVPFFGLPASTDRSPIVLALQGPYPIIVAAALRRGRGYRFRIECAKVFVPRALPGESREETLTRELGVLNRAVEDLIRRAPGQYFWLHDRWRTRPPGEESAEPRTDGPSPGPEASPPPA